MGKSTPTILCVLDDAETLQPLTALLRQQGYRVIAEQSRAAALGKLRCCLFDVIILDVHLADGSGIELCKEIREKDKSTPILFYTSDSSARYIEEAIRAGAQAYLSPPIYPAVLVESVARLLKEARSS